MTHTWGEPITVTDGKRPDWLRPNDVVLLTGWPMLTASTDAVVWSTIKAFQLRADHPYYQSAAGALGYATRLLLTLDAKHWPERARVKPADTLLGVLTQIDHLTVTLVPQSVADGACERTVRECIAAVDLLPRYPEFGDESGYSKGVNNGIKSAIDQLTAMLPDPVKTLAEKLFSIGADAANNGTDRDEAIARYILNDWVR